MRSEASRGRHVVLAVLAGALLVMLVGPAHAAGHARATDKDEPMFADLAGNKVHLSDHRGEVVLLNFWGTFCAPCRQEMPVFVHLHDELAPKGLRVICAAADGPSDAAKVVQFMKDLGGKQDVWLWVTAGDMKHYGVGPGIPATLILDREGQVRQRFQGVVNEATLRPLLEAVLAEGDAKTP